MIAHEQKGLTYMFLLVDQSLTYPKPGENQGNFTNKKYI